MRIYKNNTLKKIARRMLFLTTIFLLSTPTPGSALSPEDRESEGLFSRGSNTIVFEYHRTGKCPH